MGSKFELPYRPAGGPMDTSTTTARRNSSKSRSRRWGDGDEKQCVPSFREALALRRRPPVDLRVRAKCASGRVLQAKTEERERALATIMMDL